MLIFHILPWQFWVFWRESTWLTLRSSIQWTQTHQKNLIHWWNKGFKSTKIKLDYSSCLTIWRGIHNILFNWFLRCIKFKSMYSLLVSLNKPWITLKFNWNFWIELIHLTNASEVRPLFSRIMWPLFHLILQSKNLIDYVFGLNILAVFDWGVVYNWVLSIYRRRLGT